MNSNVTSGDLPELRTSLFPTDLKFGQFKMKLTIAVCSVLALSSLAIVGTPDFDATDDDLLSEHVVAIVSGDDKSDFVQVTQTRVKMKNPVAQLCREPFPSELQHNLHGDKYLHVFVNKLGLKVFRSGTGTYCLLYTSPSPRDLSTSRMPSSA